MATQRLIVIKVAGIATDSVMSCVSRWSAARTTSSQSEWGPEQWPDSVRQEIDRFVETLRTHAAILPILYYTEWVDMWSMGDVFGHRLNTSRDCRPTQLYGIRYEVYCHELAQLRRLNSSSSLIDAHASDETRWYFARLKEAADAWAPLVDRAVVLVIRQSLGGLVEDHEIEASLLEVPDWLPKS
jgi:hypothetical protein